MRSHVLLTVVLALLGSSTASAQDWAKKMFTTSSHDFGTVVRGAKTEFRFPFKNIYVEDLHVASVRSSCGCTTPDVTKRDVKTYETSEIVAVFNTHAFLGHRSATITVTFDKPYYAEVQLQVSGNIRGDIVVQPSLVDIGKVDQGIAVERSISVTRSGKSDWKIMDVRCANTNFEVEVLERGRSGSQVTYDLKIRLKESAVAGYLNDQLILITNDDRAGQFPIAVEGRVVPEMTITTLLNFGTLEAGQRGTKPMIVRGKKPFRISAIHCDDPRFTFKLPDANDPPKAIHQIPVTFVADEQSGKVVKQITVEIDGAKRPLPAVVAQAIVKTAELSEPVPVKTEVTKPETSLPEARLPQTKVNVIKTDELEVRQDRTSRPDTQSSVAHGSLSRALVSDPQKQQVAGKSDREEAGNLRPAATYRNENVLRQNRMKR